MNHDARLLEPPGIEWVLTPPEQRPPVATIHAHPGPDRCYSEVSGWRLLAAVIEALTGETASRWVDEQVLAPLGLAGEVVLAGQDLAVALDAGRVLHPLGGLPVEAIPMLHVHAPGYRRRVGPELVGLASARAVGGVAEALADAHAGTCRLGVPSSSTLRAVTERAGPRAFDRTWRRPTRFELGFEVLPADGRTWGLTAYLATALVVVDVDRRAGACLVLDGATPDPDDLAACRRQLLAALAAVPVP